MSWDVAARVPAPEIYRTDGVMVEQWVLVGKWGTDNGDSAMVFREPLSQDQACSCTTNTPTQAWNQMVNRMNAKPLALAWRGGT